MGTILWVPTYLRPKKTPLLVSSIAIGKSVPNSCPIAHKVRQYCSKGIHLYVPSQRAMLISAFHSEAQIVTDIQNDYLILALLAIPEVS